MSLTGFLSGGLPMKKRKTAVGEMVMVEMKLFPPTADKFPEFHLPTVIKEQTGKSYDNDHPFGDNEEFRRLDAIKQKFEEKYGPKRDKKGRKIKFGKPEDYMDLGMGYDLEDPFIDDSEGYDELVPSTLTPVHGGFYVNRGPLEFKERSDSDDTDEEDEQNGKSPRATKEASSSSAMAASGDAEESSDGGDVGSSDSCSDSDSGSDSSPDVSIIEPPPSKEKPSGAPNARASKEGSVLKTARPSMTPKQKASANLLKNSKGWSRKLKGTTSAMESKDGVKVKKSENRLNDVVDSVVAAAGPKSDVVAMEVSGEGSAEAPPTNIDDTIQLLLKNVTTSSNAGSGSKQKPVANSATISAVEASNKSESDSFKNVDKRIELPKKAPAEESKPSKAITTPASQQQSESTKVSSKSSSNHPPAPQQSTPRLAGKPPTLATVKRSSETQNQSAATWVVPERLRKLNATILEHASVSGSLQWNGRTDEVLKTMMLECRALRLSEQQSQAVLDDLGKRLKCKVTTILARWEKIKQRSTPATTSNDATVGRKTTAPAPAAAAPAPAPAETPSASSAAPVVNEHKNAAAAEDFSSVSLAGLLQLLRQEIEQKMPTLEMDHRRLAEETALKKIELLNGSNGSTEGERQRNVYTPRRKFVWSDRTRKVLCAIVEKVINRIMRDEAIDDKEEAVRVFLEQKVATLWPNGWMSGRELMKESKDVHGRLPQTKPKEGQVSTSDDSVTCIRVVSASGVPTTASSSNSSQTTTTTTKSAATTAGQLLSRFQESVSKSANSSAVSPGNKNTHTTVSPLRPAAVVPVQQQQRHSSPHNSSVATGSKSNTSTASATTTSSTPKSATAAATGSQQQKQQQHPHQTSAGSSQQQQPKAAAAAATLQSTRQRMGFSIHNLTSSTPITATSSTTTAASPSSAGSFNLSNPSWPPPATVSDEQRGLEFRQQYAAMFNATVAANQGSRPSLSLPDLWTQYQQQQHQRR